MNKIGGRSNTAFSKLDSLILTWSPILLPSFYFVREANGRALVVSILGKFISQESFKSVSTVSQNNSNNDSEVGKAKVAKLSPKRKVLKQKRKSRERRQSTSSSSDSEETER